MRKTRTPEDLGLLEPGESAKPTGVVGSADLVELGVESAKLTPGSVEPTGSTTCWSWRGRMVESP